jgi:predicted transcriptional regulator
MNNLQFHPLDTVDQLVRPDDYQHFDLSSSALELLTDFTRVNPLVIDSDTLAEDAEKLMLKTHVKLKVVINSDSEFIGLISYDNISAQNIMRLVASGIARKDIKVADLMMDRSAIKALDYKDISKASIGDVVEALKSKGVQHCLVVDSESHHIRGLISASDIARKLHLSIPIYKQPSFIEIFNEIKH